MKWTRHVLPITAATSLDLSGLTSTMYGLNFFDNLRFLNFKNSNGDLFLYLPSTIDSLNLEASSYGSLNGFPPNIKWLNISNTSYSGAGDILSALPASLEYFNAANSGISQFPIFPFPTGLKYLNVSLCRITGFASLPANLDTLICDSQIRYDNLSSPILQGLPLLPSTLKYLDCSNNGITAILSLPPGLKYLNCSGQTVEVNSALTYEEVQALSSLPTLPAGLEYLNCANDALGGLSVLPATLIYLDCSNNAFTHPVFDGIDWITYSSFGIPNFASLPQGLAFINVGGNRMTSLPALPSGLIDLSVSGMNIPAMPALPSTLRFLDVSGTLIFCLPTLPPSMLLQSPFRSLAADLVVNGGIKCLPNRLQRLRIKTHGSFTYNTVSLPVCNFFNNPENCPVVPTMSGLCFYDNNSNGVLDAGESPMGGVEFSLGNGEVAFSGDNGLYAIGGELGINNLTITPRPYYTAVPAALNYNFSRYNTVVNATIALKPNIIFDSLKITITPLDPARPGFPFAYQVKFENVGTTSMPNAVVEAIFDNTKMDYQYSSPGVALAGNVLTFNAGPLTPGQRGEFTSNFILLTTVALGSEIAATATITSGTKVYTDHSSILVQGSFDPNEKYATNVLTRQELQNGAYIDYTVCFQNTGTDTAFNVQILDELDSMLDWTSFMPVASSHPCISKRAGNYLTFEFRNILLPDSTTNERASHAYVRFRVKPMTGLPDNTNIPNTAGIYFDFNVPVVTATVSSLVNLTTVPVGLTDFTAGQEGRHVMLRWNTSQEINSRNFIVEHAGADRQWKAILSKAAAGNSQVPTFYEAADYSPVTGANYYRLRMNDIDGSFIYSQTRQVGFAKEGTITVSPNPAQHFVLLRVDASMIGAAISVFDQSGNKVFSGIIAETSMELNIARWQRGIYYVNIVLKDKKMTEKLAVE
ncbi:MAG: T9SS type A sorting domain-containing protein [Ferruginibacter sp.]